LLKHLDTVAADFSRRPTLWVPFHPWYKKRGLVSSPEALVSQLLVDAMRCYEVAEVKMI